MPLPFPNVFRIKLMTNISTWLITQDKSISVHAALHFLIFATNYLHQLLTNLCIYKSKNPLHCFLLTA